MADGLYRQMANYKCIAHPFFSAMSYLMSVSFNDLFEGKVYIVLS